MQNKQKKGKVDDSRVRAILVACFAMSVLLVHIFMERWRPVVDYTRNVGVVATAVQAQFDASCSKQFTFLVCTHYGSRDSSSNTTHHCLLQEVKDSGIRVDVALLSALIAALGSEGLAEEALAVFRKMVRTGSSKHTCSTSSSIA